MSPEKSKSDDRKRKGFRMPDEAREHLHAARDEMWQSWETLMPPGFIEHRRAARREVLLAAQSLIQHALERLES
jgi:hypothetical protein